MKNRYLVSIIVTIVIVFSGRLLSQVIGTNNLPELRKYEIMVVKGSTVPGLVGSPVDQLYVYSFHDGNGWEPIPFQIDEYDPEYFDPSDGLFDETDELVFLVQDMGDRISLGNWIDDEDSKSRNRYEIEAVEPTDESKKGWCYIFRSTTLTAADKSPVKYVQYDHVNQKISGKYYTIEYENGWFPVNQKITTDNGGNNIDFYDRTKLRVILVPVVFPWVFLEDSLVMKEMKVTEDPVIRIRRELKLDLILKGTVFQDNIPFNTFYNPYSTRFSGKLAVEEAWKVKSIRMSYDFNENAIGMKFYSGDSMGVRNNNFNVDGTHDAIDDSLTRNIPNWTMITGTPGSMLTFNSIDYESHPFYVSTYEQSLYYWDNTSGNLPVLNDFDTGDRKSYGDHGMIFKEIAAEDYSLVGAFTYKTTSYLMGANQSVTAAQQMFNNFLVNLWYSPHLQTYEIGVSEYGKPQIPGKFALKPNYPNPFNPSTTLSFDIPTNEMVQMTIFDLNGRHVKTIVDRELQAGSYAFTWDATDDYGNQMSTGLYICSINSKNFTASQKLLLVK